MGKNWKQNSFQKLASKTGFEISFRNPLKPFARFRQQRLADCWVGDSGRKGV
jgi:hypothetical protein